MRLTSKSAPAYSMHAMHYQDNSWSIHSEQLFTPFCCICFQLCLYTLDLLTFGRSLQRSFPSWLLQQSFQEDLLAICKNRWLFNYYWKEKKFLCRSAKTHLFNQCSQNSNIVIFKSYLIDVSWAKNTSYFQINYYNFNIDKHGI